MINLTDNQKRYVWTPSIPSTWTNIKYTVRPTEQQDPIFIGQSPAVPGFEIDATDWIERMWESNPASSVYSAQLYIKAEDPGISGSSLVKRFSYDKYALSISSDETVPSCPYMKLVLYNSDFKDSSGRYTIKIPLEVENGILKGKTANRIEKVTYMDRYGDSHNTVSANRYELEAYISSEYLNTVTGDDMKYQQIMALLQSARRTVLSGTAGISGIDTSASVSLECKVKDVTEVVSYSRYGTVNKVPSLKIKLEIYR